VGEEKVVVVSVLVKRYVRPVGYKVDTGVTLV
jgi:hypothetical protein